jgi:hypothetical protein
VFVLAEEALLKAPPEQPLTAVPRIRVNAAALSCAGRRRQVVLGIG